MAVIICMAQACYCPHLSNESPLAEHHKPYLRAHPGILVEGNDRSKIDGVEFGASILTGTIHNNWNRRLPKIR